MGSIEIVKEETATGEALFFMEGEVSGQQTVPDQKPKDDWAQELDVSTAAMIRPDGLLRIRPRIGEC